MIKHSIKEARQQKGPGEGRLQKFEKGGISNIRGVFIKKGGVRNPLPTIKLIYKRLIYKDNRSFT